MRAGERGDAPLIHRMAMIADPRLYFDYFATLLAQRPRAWATGDLTPDYALLSAARLTHIRDEFAARDLRTVAVFLMRDPVDRVWSHLRMKMHRKPHAFSGSPLDELAERYAEPAHAIRTQYHQTLTALDTSLDPEDTHVGLYETLFADDRQVRAITDLIGIAARSPDLGTPRNASPGASELPDAVARVVAEHYATTYREVAARRPDLEIERWWPYARHVL